MCERVSGPDEKRQRKLSYSLTAFLSSTVPLSMEKVFLLINIVIREMCMCVCVSTLTLLVKRAFGSQA